MRILFMLNQLKNDLQKLANPAKAKKLQQFFKTGKGEYGQGDKFLGIVVPLQRKIAAKYKRLALADLKKLLNSDIHEHRLTALFILVSQFQKAKEENARRAIYDLYLTNTENINNWDLIDLSSPHIIGRYLLDKDRTVLYNLARSESIWEKRIAVLATFWFIRNNGFQDAIKIAEILVNDKHDLIHKAVGWMLREIGKRDKKELISFLEKYSYKMPRIMLRYAIEKLPENKRRYYLKRKVC
jgi:3-methyladenine DNA glycosylase AlkD